MTHINSSGFTVVAALIALGCAGYFSTAGAEPVEAVVAIDTEPCPEAGGPCGDPESNAYPQGCVDCHRAGGPETIGALLEALGHQDVDDAVAAVPGDCADCHGDEGGAWLMSELAHVLHFEDPASNSFVQDFGGNCLHCHAMDEESGAVTMRSGPKNW